MRGFNSFSPKNKSVIQKKEAPEKPKYSAYRTIISRHEAAAARLQNEPSAVIPNEQ